jgi:hypothetical protein
VTRLAPWWLFFLIGCFSILSVYCTYASIHASDVDTGVVYAKESVSQYRDALNGTRAFPYQWRLLGVYLVYFGERATGWNPNAIDIVVKAVLMCASSITLFLFVRLSASVIASLCAVALYQLLTVVGFIDGYNIYYTNDYAMMAAWFGAVYALKVRRFAAAALLTFIGSWAKETMVLVPILIGLMVWRRRAPFWALVLAVAAFVAPTAALRWIYQTPLQHWAWWQMLFVNVPFLQTSRAELMVTLKNNIKVALFFNVLWIVAARAAWRSRDRFEQDLAATSVIYLVLAYPVIYIRELRHFLPLAIVVLPLAVGELERHADHRSDSSTSATATNTNTNG